MADRQDIAHYLALLLGGYGQSRNNARLNQIQLNDFRDTLARNQQVMDAQRASQALMMNAIGQNSQAGVDFRNNLVGSIAEFSPGSLADRVKTAAAAAAPGFDAISGRADRMAGTDIKGNVSQDFEGYRAKATDMLADRAARRGGMYTNIEGWNDALRGEREDLNKLGFIAEDVKRRAANNMNMAQLGARVNMAGVGPEPIVYHGSRGPGSDYIDYANILKMFGTPDPDDKKIGTFA